MFKVTAERSTRSPDPLRDNPEVSVRSRGSISATSTVRDLIETGLS
jgi:hypothetical protein